MFIPECHALAAHLAHSEPPDFIPEDDRDALLSLLRSAPGDAAWLTMEPD